MCEARGTTDGLAITRDVWCFVTSAQVSEYLGSQAARGGEVYQEEGVVP
jgi:hypothetical protein